MREVIVTGKTVEEATEKACLELGLPREEVSIEILEMPTRKLFKSTPAKVKATAEETEEPAAQQPAVPQKPAAPAPKAEQRQAPEAPKAPEKKPQAPAAEETVEAEQTEQEPAPDQGEGASLTEAQQAKLDAAVEYLKTVFAAMGAGDVAGRQVCLGKIRVGKVGHGLGSSRTSDGAGQAYGRATAGTAGAQITIGRP